MIEQQNFISSFAWKNAYTQFMPLWWVQTNSIPSVLLYSVCVCLSLIYPHGIINLLKLCATLLSMLRFILSTPLRFIIINDDYINNNCWPVCSRVDTNWFKNAIGNRNYIWMANQKESGKGSELCVENFKIKPLNKCS